MDATYRRASTEIDGKNKFDAASMRVDEHGSITGTCVGSKETDRYLVRVRVSVASERDARRSADWRVSVRGIVDRGDVRLSRRDEAPVRTAQDDAW